MTATVCSVGSTDPWNAAGLGLDIRALAECGVRPVVVVAGITAQGPAGITALHAVPGAIVKAQLAALASAHIAAYRIGALLDTATVGIVADALADVNVPIVADPVVAASAGGIFADAAVRAAIIERLLPCVTLLTPNLAEAAVLTDSSVDSVDAMEAAGVALRARGARAVLVKGGHLSGDAVDVLVDANGTLVYRSPRLARGLRGTGCLLACATAAHLARGAALRDAIAIARAFVREKMENGRDVDGMRVAY